MAVARWLETDSLSNQDISSALAIGAYTADADRMIVCDVSVDQAAGNGDYVIYVTRQINGAGSAYVLLPKTTCAAASGETAIAMQSAAITVRSGDVLTVYLDGLAGDTTTPDTTVRWFEMAALRPATADRTLAVDASGLVDLVDAPNATAVTAIATKTLTTLIIPNLVSGSLAEYVYDTKIASGYGYIINNAIGAWTGSGVNTVLGAFKALLSKTASTPSDIGGTFDPATDSVEALRDRGDAAWVTADVSALATAAALATVDGIVDDILVDTGTTIPGLLAAELSSSSDSTTSGAITRTRGNTWTINATIGAITGYTSLWFTVKHSQDDADSDAILQIKLNSSGSDDDLIYVNGATASDSTLGAITVSDASTGAIIIAVDETVTDDMPAGAFYYDVQVLNSGAVTTPDSGTFTITADVTRSVT